MESQLWESEIFQYIAGDSRGKGEGARRGNGTAVSRSHFSRFFKNFFNPQFRMLTYWKIYFPRSASDLGEKTVFGQSRELLLL